MIGLLLSVSTVGIKICLKKFYQYQYHWDGYLLRLDSLMLFLTPRYLVKISY